MNAPRRRGRGAGEGSIYKRKDGRWCGALRTADGKKKYFYGRTRDDVVQKLNRAIGRQLDGLPLPNERTTLAGYLRDWLELSARPNVRPWTYRGYEVHVRRHIVPALGKVPLAKLTTAQVRRWVSDKLKSGLAPKTVHYMKTTLSTALNQAVGDGLLARNVAATVRTSKKPRKKARPLDLQETRRFLRAIRGDRFEALYLVALLGLRQGEVLGLRWPDVNFRNGQLEVDEALQRVELDGPGPRVEVDGTLQRVERRYDLGDPKSEGSERPVKLPPTVVTKLREHRARQLEERLAAGTWGNEWDLVFTTVVGKPLSGRVVLSAFQRKLAEAGLPKVRFHDLRHSCSSLLQAKGISPRVVQQQLGHSDLSMTLRYTKVLPELAEAAARRMEDILASANEAEYGDDQEHPADEGVEGSGGCQDGCQTGPDDPSRAHGAA